MMDSYTFTEYLQDRNIIVPEPAMKHTLALWDIHGDEYLDYCADEGLESEDLSGY